MAKEEQDFSYESFQGNLVDVLKRKRRADKTLKQNRSNLNALIPRAVHEGIVRRLREKRGLTREKYGGALSEMLRESVERVMESDLSVSTKQSRHATARTILTSMGYEKVEIGSLLPSLSSYDSKKEAKVPVPITNDEYNSLIWAMENIEIKSHLDLRDRAIYVTSRNTGAKPSEIVNLKHKDIDFLSEIIALTNKDCEVRHVGVDQSTLSSILDYIELVPYSVKEGTLFKNKHGNKLSIRSLIRNFKERMKVAEINPERQEVLEMMCFRYAFAKDLVDLRSSLPEFMGLLGVKKRRAEKIMAAF